ncbi:MAG: hypothetical protein C3F11_19625 [Methylocystaceae bacterium]|nr:MAG: hypothetical protein C3F11_19625 [Methylocystaceae bacterium]
MRRQTDHAAFSEISKGSRPFSRLREKTEKLSDRSGAAPPSSDPASSGRLLPQAGEGVAHEDCA